MTLICLKLRLSKLWSLLSLASNWRVSLGEYPTFKNSFQPSPSSLSHSTSCSIIIHPSSRARSIKNLFRVKNMFTSSLTMASPIKSWLLTLYLTSIKKSIGAFLAREVDEIEHLVYQVTSRCCDELFFDWTSLPRAYICYSKTPTLLISSQSQPGHEIQSSQVIFISTNNVRLYCSMAFVVVIQYHCRNF